MAPRKGKNTSFEVRQLVIFNASKGKSGNEISKLFNIPRSTVYDILRRFERENRIESLKQNGAPEKLTEIEKRFIRKEIEKNPKVSGPKLATALLERTGKTITAQTVRNTIKSMGYNSRTARLKPLLSTANIEKRFNFAKEYRMKDETFWNNVIFTDESKYNVFSSDGKVRVWRKPNTEFQKQNLKPTVKHGGGSVMVWGCFAASGVGSLVFIDGIMNADMYIEILKKNLHSSAEKLGIRRTFHFYQDNDPKHKAYNTKAWLLYNCPKVIETPPQSPDCNPIENLWEYLDKKVREHSISSKTELRRILEEEWYKIPVQYLQKLVSSVPRRLHAVYKAKGMHTKY